jgi:hypothetical protein
LIGLRILRRHRSRPGSSSGCDHCPTIVSHHRQVCCNVRCMKRSTVRSTPVTFTVPWSPCGAQGAKKGKSQFAAALR